MESKVPRNFATNQQLVILEQAAQPASKDLQDALPLVKEMKSWKSKQDPKCAKHPALRKRMSNLYKYWKAIAQGKPAKLAVYTRRRRRVLGGNSGGGGGSVSSGRAGSTRRPIAQNPAARKKAPARVAPSGQNRGGGDGGKSVKRRVVVASKSSHAAGARATSATLEGDGDKYAALLKKIIDIPLGGQEKEKKLLETLRELAKYKPDTAELTAAGNLTAVIMRLSRAATMSSPVKQLAKKRLSDWELSAKMRDLKEGKQRKYAAAAMAGRTAGDGSGTGPRHRARRSSLPPMRFFKDVCAEYDPGLKECVSSAKPSLVASTLKSLSTLGKYRPKPAEIEAAVATINSVKALRKHENPRIQDQSSTLYTQWKAVIRG